MLTEVWTPYTRMLAGLTLALALVAPLAAEVGGAQTQSLRDVAAQVLSPGALVAPSASGD